MEKANTVKNKTTVSYKAMASCKKLDGFFEEEDKEVKKGPLLGDKTGKI